MQGTEDGERAHLLSGHATWHWPAKKIMVAARGTMAAPSPRRLRCAPGEVQRQGGSGAGGAAAGHAPAAPSPSSAATAPPRARRSSRCSGTSRACPTTSTFTLKQCISAPLTVPVGADLEPERAEEAQPLPRDSRSLMAGDPEPLEDFMGIGSNDLVRQPNPKGGGQPASEADRGGGEAVLGVHVAGGRQPTAGPRSTRSAPSTAMCDAVARRRRRAQAIASAGGASTSATTTGGRRPGVVGGATKVVEFLADKLGAAHSPKDRWSTPSRRRAAAQPRDVVEFLMRRGVRGGLRR